MVLLGGPEDSDLLWLAAALKRRGEAVDIVLPEELLGGTLTCRIDRASVSSSLTLRDGRTIGGDETRLVVNRLTWLPVSGPQASAIDAAYIGEEWRAVMTAWLRTLDCPVLNPPRAASLGGPLLTETAWRSLARAHGIACLPWASGAPTEMREPAHVICVGAACLDPSGAAPPDVLERLRRMARFAGTPLLGAQFDRSAGWQFAGATPFPAFAAFGTPLVDAIVALTLTPARTP